MNCVRSMVCFESHSCRSDPRHLFRVKKNIPSRADLRRLGRDILFPLEIDDPRLLRRNLSLQAVSFQSKRRQKGDPVSKWSTFYAKGDKKETELFSGLSILLLEPVAVLVVLFFVEYRRILIESDLEIEACLFGVAVFVVRFAQTEVHKRIVRAAVALDREKEFR